MPVRSKQHIALAQIVGALTVCGLLAACTISYKAVGRYTDGSEKFIGDVNASIFGGGDVVVKSTSTDVECAGRSEVIEVPSVWTCAGQVVSIDLRCSDGRSMTGTATATSCTTGVGHGQDNEGRAIEFAFGLTKAEAQAFVTAPTLPRRASGPPAVGGGKQLMTEVEAALAARGYDPGNVDGAVGWKTRDAILQFQTDQGMKPTGRANAETLTRLGLRP